jgi:uncharacterized protein DUF6285
MRDLPSSLDLLALARELLLDELVPLLPRDRQRDAHLIATAMAIAAREARAEQGWQTEIGAELAQFYGSYPAPGGGEGATSDEASILRRFAGDLRNGAVETSSSRAAAGRAILWRLTIEKLREGNPNFLAANGFQSASGKGE